MKGQSTIPFTVIEAATTMLILLSLAYGTQAETNEFVKEETLGLQTKRVTNAMIAVNSMPSGFLELEMEGYGFKYDEGNITMNYSGTEETKALDLDMVNYDNVEGPSTVTRVNGTLCIKKAEDSVELSVGNCRTEG